MDPHAATISQIALSLTAGGLTTGEIAAHWEEVYGVRVGKDTIYLIIGKLTSSPP